MNDGLAYAALFPLLLTSVLSLVTALLLFINRKNWPTNLFILKLSVPLLLCIGSVLTVLVPNLLILAVTAVLIATVEILIIIIQIKAAKQAKIAEQEKLAAEKAAEEEALAAAALAAETEENNPLRKMIEAGRDFMIHAADAFSDDSGLNTLLDKINTTIIRETNADGGVILLLDDFDDVLAVKNLSGDFPPPYKLPEDLPHKIVRVETNFRFAQFPLNETIFGAIARSGKPELITEPLSDNRIYQNEDEDFLKCGSYIFMPLKIRDTVIGVSAISRKATSTKFTNEDFTNATILADFASTAIKLVYSYQEVVEHAELTKEAGIACKLQNSLHPKLLPAIPSLSLGCYYKTAEGVCGDYYDIVPARKDRISFILGDIAGKGMNSLMIMVMLRAMLRLTVNTTQSAGTILGWANRGITGETQIDHFASVALINYDSETKNVQIASAGTTPVLLYSAEKDSITQVSETNEPVGVEKTTVYSDKEFTVQSGDIIVAYTDGVVETPNERGIQYSQERLMELVKNNKKLSGKEIADVVKSDIVKFSGSGYQHDDQTLLIIKVQ